jgi:hypothetical protein
MTDETCRHGFHLNQPEKVCVECEFERIEDARRHEDMNVPFTEAELDDIRLWAKDQTRGAGRRTAKPVTPRRNAILIARLLANIDEERARRATGINEGVVIDAEPRT